MYIDIGAISSAEVKNSHQSGDPVIPICPFTVLVLEKLIWPRHSTIGRMCLFIE